MIKLALGTHNTLKKNLLQLKGMRADEKRTKVQAKREGKTQINVIMTSDENRNYLQGSHVNINVMPSWIKNQTKTCQN